MDELQRHQATETSNAPAAREKQCGHAA